jgi:hypothetical protein
MSLLRLERWLDRTVTAALARTFPSPLDIVELESALVRECDDKAMSIPGGHTVVPNEFAIALSPRDHRSLDSNEILVRLKKAISSHVQSEGYTLAGPIAIMLVKDSNQLVGLAAIRAAILAEGIHGEQASSAYLVIGTRRIGLPEGTFSIGRDDALSLRLDDVAVSRHHCDINKSGEQVTIHDRGSTNGTIVNGVRITRGELHHGDVVTIGSTEAVFEVSQ